MPLGKAREAAQVAEHDNDFASMVLKRLLVRLRGDEIRDLRRKKPFEPADPLQLRDLTGHALLEIRVDGLQLRAL